MLVRLSHEPGDFIDPGKRFRVVEKIGAGGMASVYLVQDDSGQQHAVKECDLLDDPRGKHLSRDEAVAAFVREAQQLGRLQAAGIPRGSLLICDQEPVKFCLQCGNRVEQGLVNCGLCRVAATSLFYEPQVVTQRYYLVMEYIPGQDASQAVRKMQRPLQTMDLAHIRAWMIALARILVYLHHKGLVHRDIKSENLRIRQGDGELFLLDYGLLSKAWDAKGTKSLKADGNYGSEGYAPPEQAMGQAVPQSDVFALAKTLLHLLTGLDPANPLENRELEMVSPQVLVPGLADNIAQLISKSLATDPQKRPSAQDWLTLLLAEHRLIPSHGYQAQSKPSQSALPTGGPLPKAFPLAWVGLGALVMLAIVVYSLMQQSGRVSYMVAARQNAVMYHQPDAISVARRLKGGERLRVTTLGQENWLKVLAVDEVKERGYIRRNRVDTLREDP